MSDTTTIQLRKSTKQNLAHLKRADGESFDSVVERLIAKYDEPRSGDMDETRVRELIREEITENVVREAQR
jgi:predicted CopG family antitoxin